ncbi:MAG: peptidoglycan-binding protein [Clostridia bacterium]|nr:peptidoglycan-binding protein [Clostridia bacterium]
MRNGFTQRFLALVLALLVAVPLFSAQADEKVSLIYGTTTAAAALYDSAEPGAKMLTAIPANTQVLITRQSGDYYVVIYSHFSGYVAKSLIQTNQSGTAATSSESIYVEVALKNESTHTVALQQALKELGFYTGKVDGMFGNGTRKAVLAFQKANGIRQTGAGDTATQVLLYEGQPKNSKGKAVTVKTAPTVLEYALSTGNTGIAVEELQKRLNELGYYKRSADGVYGSSTASAVKAFQKANGLSQTGRADYATQNLLYNNRSTVVAKLTATSKGMKATATPKPTAAPAAAYPFTTYTYQSVNLRKSASSTSARLLTVPRGAEITVLSVGNDFVKATYNKKTGYIAAEYVNIPEQYLPGKTLAEDSNARQHYPYLQSSSTGEEVAVLQKALKELGFYSGNADGSFGASTAAALKAFQKKNGLRQDAIATPEIQQLILEGRPLNSKGKRTDVKVLPLIADVDLKQGDQGQQVVDLQNRLISVGAYTGQPTGTFDSATAMAVKQFQKEHSLYVDGIVGKKTRQLLYLLSATAAPTPYVTPTPVPTAVPVATPTPITAKNVVVMRNGTTGEAVKRLQQRLMDLGYYTCNVDGVYNADDIAAVRAFQAKNSLSIDGVAGLATQQRLYSDSALPATTVPLPTAASNPNTDIISAPITTVATATPAPSNEVLRIGSTGATVKALQQRLASLGYYTGKVDGQFGTGTAAAVTKFQRANKLTADGVAGAKTLNKLYSSSAVAVATPKPTDAAAATTTATLLRNGDTGKEVKAMQKRLVELGYLNAADGIYGMRTYNAVVAFQKRNGLKADGIAGKMTLNKLNSSSAIAAAGASQNTATVVTTSANASSAAFKVPSASEVRNANWFSEIRARAKLMPNVVIYDPDTGLHFNLHMFSFGKHADSETPTSADTEVLNKICGVNSWTPHYVWVIFTDGRVYIGSIHSHGHSVDHTSGNNLDGHICLHFPRVMSEAEATGPYAVSHQKEILYGWEVTQAMAK